MRSIIRRIGGGALHAVRHGELNCACAITQPRGSARRHRL